MERRSDPLRHWKGLVITQLKFFPDGLTHMALLLRIGGKMSHKDSRNLDSALKQLTFAGIVKCDIAGGRMVYKYGR